MALFGAHPARGKRPPSSGCFPSRSRLGGLEDDPYPRGGVFRLVRGSASSSLPSKLKPASTGTTPNAPRFVRVQDHYSTPSPTLRRRHRAMLRARPNPASSTVPTTPLTLPPPYAQPPSKAASKETMERRAQDTPLDVVNCHEKEGRYVKLEGAIPAHVRRGMDEQCTQRQTHVLAPRPLVYKRGREAHAKGKTRREHKSQTHTDHNQGPRSSSPSPTLLVNPYHEQHATRCIAPLLDVRPRGRNQDKTPSLTLAIRETSG
nr:unnamed protein product [Digitaria exilis]